MTTETPYTLGTPVRVKISGDLHNGYVTAVYPPQTSFGAYQYDVKLFKRIYGFDKVERLSYIWLVAIGGGDL